MSSPALQHNPVSPSDVLSGNSNGTVCCLNNSDPQLGTVIPGLNETLICMLIKAVSKQRFSPKTKKSFKKEYDYIVVGAGSAGCALAARLSEKKCASVLLLEAGGIPPPLSEIPYLGRLFAMTDINWNYFTEPQKHAGNCIHKKKVPMPQGKVLGGTSIWNGMIFVRGNHKDFKDWESRETGDWSWDDVFKYYLKLEDNKDNDIANNGYHNVSGPVTYTRVCYNPEIKSEILKVVKKLGYPYIDPNGAKQIGWSDYQGNIRKGQRCSAAKAYLVPAENRKNLHIVPNAYVTKVIISRKRARGVWVDFKDYKHFVRARKEVIISAGAMNSPKILMLSGVGPKEILRKHKIPVVADLPVGKNFHDHFAAVMNYRVRRPNSQSSQKQPSMCALVQQYVKHRCGPFTSTEGVVSMAFQRSNDSTTPKDVPNYQLYFFEGSPLVAKYTVGMKRKCYDQLYKPYESDSMLWCISSNLRPKSRGYISLRSDDPYEPPVVEPNYMKHPDDIKDVIAGMKACNKVCLSPTMKKFGVRPFETLMRGCEHLVDEEDEYMECYARAFPFSPSHFAGSCKMGHPKDPTTVVDYKLRVKGIQGLRVADASIMPKVISGNTHTPCMMIGEKAADMIKRTIRCR